MTTTENDLNFNVDEAASLLLALSLPVRLKALRLMAEREWDVKSLADALGATQSSMSQHLSLFRRLRIVTTRKDRQWIYYSAPSRDVQIMLDLIDTLER